LGCIIGQGAFGKVHLLTHVSSKQHYALKYINKKECIARKMQKSIVKEVEMLTTLSHPFIVKIEYSFQDDVNMYMIMNFCSGGDLRYVLDQSKHALDQEAILVWAAELSTAVDYIHSKQIIHRDIKPDNILLSSDGQ
jgi:serine/threonine kinase 32